MSQLEYRDISDRTKQLLSSPENYDVEFKEARSGLKNDDIVAFANSPIGGTIFIGIKEIKLSGGEQRGQIVGCDIGDKEKQAIISAAENCVPQIEIEVITENLDDVPFFRVEIPSWGNKPYCTGGGTYKIRGDARTIPLLPSRLLEMFMEVEAQKFLERFRIATTELEKRVDTLSAKVILLEPMLADLSSDLDPVMELVDMWRVLEEVQEEVQTGFMELEGGIAGIRSDIRKLTAKSQMQPLRALIDRIFGRNKLF